MTELRREDSAGYLTNWAARLLARAIDRRLRAEGLYSGQLPVFFALADGKPRTQKELAALASTEQPTMAATLSRMERDGLIRRTPDPKDRRSSLIELTDEARGKLGVVKRATSEINAAALADLSDAERALYLKLVKKIIATLAEMEREGA